LITAARAASVAVTDAVTAEVDELEDDEVAAPAKPSPSALGARYCKLLIKKRGLASRRTLQASTSDSELKAHSLSPDNDGEDEDEKGEFCVCDGGKETPTRKRRAAPRRSSILSGTLNFTDSGIHDGIENNKANNKHKCECDRTPSTGVWCVVLYLREQVAVGVYRVLRIPHKNSTKYSNRYTRGLSSVECKVISALFGAKSCRTLFAANALPYARRHISNSMIAHKQDRSSFLGYFDTDYKTL
jgi:hypothetical protein